MGWGSRETVLFYAIVMLVLPYIPLPKVYNEKLLNEAYIIVATDIQHSYLHVSLPTSYNVVHITYLHTYISR